MHAMNPKWPYIFACEYHSLDNLYDLGEFMVTGLATCKVLYGPTSTLKQTQHYLAYHAFTARAPFYMTSNFDPFTSKLSHLIL